MHRFRFLQLVPVLALVLANCAEPPPDFSGEWVGYGAIADDRLLPMRAFLNLHPDSVSGHFLVAGERTEIPEITVWGDSLRMSFAGYPATMLARIERDRINGRYTRIWGDTTSFPFVLFANQLPEPTPPADSSAVGTYRVVYGAYDNTSSSSIATIEIEDGDLTGSVIDSGGELGLLEGVQGNGTIQLFRFTGSQALYFELTGSEIGYRGRFQERAEPVQDVAFIRTGSDAREIERPTRMKNPDQKFLFSGLTSTGEIVTSQDERFVGKPLIIDIMGTWCHNCFDAAPLLQRTFAQYESDSLQIVSLSFEIQDDAVTGLKNLEKFRRQYGVTYPILYCGSLDEENVAARLGHQLDDFYSYPTTIFVGRDGKVIEIHTGFNGPDTGERWDEQLDEFEEALQRTINS